MLTKTIVVGSIEILEDLRMQVREDTVIKEDDVEISRTFLRYVLTPGDDLSGAPQLVQDVAADIWEGVEPPVMPPVTT
jgi:hypothetical protein